MATTAGNYRVSVLQFLPRLGEVEANLTRILDLLAGIETDLAVLPELCLSGYVFATREEVLKASEKVPGGSCFRALRDLASQRDLSIVYGFAERSGDKIFNSSILLNPDGSWHLYRKTHLFMREKLFFEPGDTGLKVFPAKRGVRVGMMVCFDWIFPEAARSLALQGADVICHPANLVLPWCQQAMITRSLENRVYSITANRIGEERNGSLVETFTGRSQILGTKGEVLARLNDREEGVATVSIAPELAGNKKATELNDLFEDRRTDLYTL
jgi:predicted amidohydrolase